MGKKTQKLNYPQKNVGLAHGFIVHGLGGFKTMLAKKMLALHIVLKPCARHSKQPMVLLYMV